MSHAAHPLESSTQASPTAHGGRSWLLRETLAGLCSTPKTLPPKLFYDEAGARLFEQICLLPEYYLTRTELSILRKNVGEIAELAGPRAALVEYGSGAGVKVRLLLDALENPAAYVAVDISEEQLARVAAELKGQYPHVQISSVAADYTRPVPLPALPADARRVAFFPGSTIGNFHPAEAAAFLTRVRRTVGPNGAIILGVDRRKDASILNAAYDDAAGVTAEFNLNLLRRIDRELGADFDLSAFRHLAFFNDDASRVEMHLVSQRAQLVHIDDTTVGFEKGETIWTESSHKYDEERLNELAGAAGLRVSKLWTDECSWFWIAFLESA
ncbi:MAG: L-histidine N(alpha)-methyltransferase [Gemmatimonadaceae bacterium]